jgi:hypothetical protein
MVLCVMVSGRVGRVGAAGTGHVTSLVDSALGKYLLALCRSVAEPDPHVFGPPGSGPSIIHAKIVRKTLIPTIMRLFLTFYL